MIALPPQKEAQVTTPDKRYWLVIFGLSAIIGIGRFLVSDVRVNEANVVVTLISACFIAIVVAGQMRFKNS